MAVTWQTSSSAYGGGAGEGGADVKCTGLPTLRSNSPVTGSRSVAYNSMVPLGDERDRGNWCSMAHGMQSHSVSRKTTTKWSKPSLACVPDAPTLTLAGVSLPDTTIA